MSIASKTNKADNWPPKFFDFLLNNFQREMQKILILLENWVIFFLVFQL